MYKHGRHSELQQSAAKPTRGLSIFLLERDSRLFPKFYIVVSSAYSFVYITADHIEFKLPEYEIMDHEIDWCLKSVQYTVNIMGNDGPTIMCVTSKISFHISFQVPYAKRIHYW